jgi:hypothetical protein
VGPQEPVAQFGVPLEIPGPEQTQEIVIGGVDVIYGLSEVAAVRAEQDRDMVLDWGYRVQQAVASYRVLRFG